MTNADAEPDLTEVVRPFVDTAVALVDAAEDMCGSGSPMADSPAMREIAAEATLRSDLWTDPVMAGLSVVGLHRFAAGDHLRAFADMFARQPVPVYAHLPVARALLDTAAHGYWLSEPGIGAEARVQRYTILRFMSAVEMKRAPADSGNPARGDKPIADIRSEGATRGWEVHKKKGGNDNYRIGTQVLPATKQLIRTLLAGDDNGPGSEVHGDIAHVSWWYLSGVTHGVTFALLNSIDMSSARQASPLTQPKAGIFTSARAVLNWGMIGVEAFEHQVDRYSQLFGTTHPGWDASKERAARLRSIVIAAIQDTAASGNGGQTI